MFNTLNSQKGQVIMNFRDWLIVIGLIIIVALIADVIRRLWSQRRMNSNIKFGLESVKGIEDDYLSELPNGGARLKTDQHNEKRDKRDCNTSKQRIEPTFTHSGVSPHTSELPTHVEQTTPQQVENTDNMSQQYGEIDSNPEDHNQHHKQSGKQGNFLHKAPLEFAPVPEPVVSSAVRTPSNDELMIPKHEQTEEIVQPCDRKEFVEVASASGSPPVSAGLHAHTDSVLKENVRSELVDSTFKSAQSFDASDTFEVIYNRNPEEVIVINLEAPKGQYFSGEIVFKMLLDNGLRLGDMDVFHYACSGEKHKKDVLFSVVNGLEPGTFNLTTIRDEHFSVLTFIMPLPGSEKPVDVFKTMLHTIDLMSCELKANISDEQHCAMTMRMLEYYREKVSRYQRLQKLECSFG